MANTAVFEHHTTLLFEKNPSLRLFFMSAPHLDLEKKRIPVDPFQEPALKVVKGLVCYGVDLAFFKRRLEPFLNQHHDTHLFFIEDNRGHLEKEISDKRASAALQHERVHFLAGDLDEALYAQIGKCLLFKSWQLITPFSGLEAPLQILLTGIKKATEEMELEVGAYSHYGVEQAAQTVSILKSVGSRGKPLIWGPSLCTPLKGAVAVVCGAGPGLKQALSWLGRIQERAVIIAAGSAINMLKKGGIDPDLAAVIDPSPIESRYAPLGHTPLLFQLGANAKVVSSCSGPLVLCGQGEMWGFEKLVSSAFQWPEQTVSSGWHVGNFATQVAADLGFDRVILVGLEGCSVDEAEYGFAVEKRAENVMDAGGVNFLGQRVRTKGDFLKGAMWLEQLIRKRPQTEFFSYSEKGLFVEGCALLDKESSLLKGAKKPDIKALLASGQRLSVAKGGAEKALLKLGGSLKECEKSVKSLIKLYEKGAFGYSYLEAILETEPFYDHVIASLWQVFKPLMVAKESGADEKIQKALFAADVIDAYKHLF